MSVLYTREEMNQVLVDLRIKPVDGNLISAQEATRVLTWRVKAERGIEHQYTDAAIRGQIRQGNLVVARQVNPRFNLFKVEDIFDLPLAPGRGPVRKKQLEDATRPLADDDAQSRQEILAGVA